MKSPQDSQSTLPMSSSSRVETLLSRNAGSCLAGDCRASGRKSWSRSGHLRHGSGEGSRMIRKIGNDSKKQALISEYLRSYLQQGECNMRLVFLANSPLRQSKFYPKCRPQDDQTITQVPSITTDSSLEYDHSYIETIHTKPPPPLLFPTLAWFFPPSPLTVYSSRGPPSSPTQSQPRHQPAQQPHPAPACLCYSPPHRELPHLSPSPARLLQ